MADEFDLIQVEWGDFEDHSGVDNYDSLSEALDTFFYGMAGRNSIYYVQMTVIRNG